MSRSTHLLSISKTLICLNSMIEIKNILLVIFWIPIIDSQLVVKPTEKTLLRDQYKSFIASCTGHGNIRVGLCWNSIVDGIFFSSFVCASSILAIAIED